MVTGKTKNLGVIGWPIAHSFSPVLQNAALQEAKLDYTYIAMPVEPARLETAVEGIRSLGFRGINVTIPHKTAILPLLDEISEEAKVIGAVNTVVNDHGRLKGCNTDADGFMDALRQTGFRPEGLNVAVLGAGGAARAVVWGLLKGGAARIRLGVRNLSRAEKLVELFRPYGDVEALDWQEEVFQKYLEQTELLVNATPLGMAPDIEAMPPVDWSRLRAGAFVYDIIYTPAKTRLLQEAETHGHPILNGEGMLAAQGAVAFKLWTGQNADLAVMRQALQKALENR